MVCLTLAFARVLCSRFEVLVVDSRLVLVLEFRFGRSAAVCSVLFHVVLFSRVLPARSIVDVLDLHSSLLVHHGGWRGMCLPV